MDADKNKRRKRIILKNTVFVFLCYMTTQVVSLAALLLKATSMPLTVILNVSAAVIITTLFYFALILPKKEITLRFANGVFFSQYMIWIVLYGYWVYGLMEMRSMALFFAILALIFLISSAIKLVQALTVAFVTTGVQLAVVYCGIRVNGQPGSVYFEILLTACFFASALLMSFLADNFNRQREEIKKAKRTAEEARDALWGEMKLAHKIQTAMVPPVPLIRGFEISAYMEPALEVGGDYYDIINLADSDWVLIGDVSGHGVTAGLIMMMLQTSVRTTLRQDPDIDPARLIAGINGVITENIHILGEDMYITISALKYNRDGSFVYSGAHQDIILYRAAGKTTEVLKTTGLWIGLKDDIAADLKNERFELGRGDVLFLYSDGLIEAYDVNMDLFSIYRLMRIVDACGGETPAEIRDSVLGALVPYRKHDDVTMVILKKKK